MGVADALAAEATAVSRALGLAIDRDERIDLVRSLAAKGGAGRVSMLQDVEAGRRTEVETITGAVVREGARHGVPTPLNTVMLGLIRGLERGYLS